MSVSAQADRSSLSVEQRSRQVWAAMLTSLLIFLVLCGAVGIGLSNFLSSITEPKSAVIKALPLSVLAVLRHNTTTPEQVTGTTNLQEGDAATTGKSDQAFITLFGDSGSIVMYFNTNLQIERLRTSPFAQNNRDISVFLRNGTIVLATVQLGDDQTASYTLSTDQAEINVAPGAHLRASVQDEQGVAITQVVVNAGHATLWAHGKHIELGPDQMAWVSGSDLPEGPAAAQVDLIRNGSFEEPPNSSSEEVSEGGLGTAGWLPLRDESGADSSEASVSITEEVNLKAAVLSGNAAGNRYVRIGMVQDINQPASFFTSIELSATVKLVKQALPVGGPVPDVYPLIIRVVYTDQQGKNHEWKRSFYFQGPDPELTDNTIIKITQGRWTTAHEMQEERRRALDERERAGGAPDAGNSVGSLFMLKSPTQGQDIAVINAIEVYGFGTEYQSWITGISLLAR
jgi:hypothetical protein